MNYLILADRASLSWLLRLKGAVPRTRIGTVPEIRMC